MRLPFDEEAVNDLQCIFAWIAKADVTTATGLISRLFDRIERLAVPEFVPMGRTGQLTDRRSDPVTLDEVEKIVI